MASYTAAQTRGSGSLGEELPSTGIDFFITNSLNSQGNYPVGYLTLEGNATANQNLSTDAAMTGSFSNIVGGITEKSIVTSETKWSLSVFGSGGSFRFTPDSTVAANSYYIKGVGPFKLDIGPSSPPSPPGYNNQYSFFFDNDGVTHPLIEDKQFFTRPNTPALNLTNDFTLSIWAKVLISDPPDDGKLFDNATGGGSGGNGFLLYHDNVSSGKWNWEIRNSGGGNTSDRVLRVRSTSSPVSNTWVHLVGVFKDGTATLYIDGVNDRELSFPTTTTAGAGSSNVRIGASDSSTIGSINAVTGSLNNCSLWNVAFNQAEVNELYDNGPQDLNEHSRADNGVAWWQLGGNGLSSSFDGGTSTWTMDSSFNGASSVNATMTSVTMSLASRVTDVPS